MICWFNNHNNNVWYNATLVFFTSTISSCNNGMYLEEDNFRKAVALYVSRNRDVLKQKWSMGNDQYLIPSEGCEP
jgi:hypothetical protein